MPRSAVIAACALLVPLGLGAGVVGAAGQAKAPAAPVVPSVRMYVFDAGVITMPDPMPLFGFRKEELAASDLADGAYLIVHPRGTLMWEAGLVPDAAIGEPNPRPGAPTRRLRDMLAEVGYQPSDVTYFAVSHGHGDHTANANDFAASTWLVARAEYDAMFASPVPRFYTAPTYAALKNGRHVFIDDDHDVFGDGTVVIRRALGHTAGHQVLVVKLARSGVVVLPGDLYHYREEIGRREVAPAQGDQTLTLQARDALEAYLQRVKGQLWITHDLGGFSRLKKAPDYYD